MKGVIVVGAGAAGLWAAASLAERGASVLLLEKTRRSGTKVLASGGTRCNLTTSLPPDEAAQLFGQHGARFLKRAFRQLPPSAVRARFASLGVPTVEAPLDKVFPASGRARDVRDALLGWAEAGRVELRLETEVRGLERCAGGWRVRAAGERTFEARRLLVCPGGKSYPQSGTRGDGYGWLEALGLPVVEPVPALVPLTSPEPCVRALAGIALQSVGVRLVDPAGRTLGRSDRPLVFSHTGISGPAAMDLSEPVARAAQRRRACDGSVRGPTHDLVLDLVPALGREDLRAWCVEAPGQGVRLARYWAQRTGLARRLIELVVRAAGIDPERPANGLARDARHRLVETLKALRVGVDGTLGFERAEVTAGGLDLRAVDPGTMGVRGAPGLYVFGELLDLAGPIGGLNFQAAFATAELAAEDAARP